MTKDIGQKRRERAKKSKAKVVLKRVAKRAEAKIELEAARKERKARAVVNREMVTVRNDPQGRTAEERLHHNMEILAALEEEMKKNDGHATIPASNWGGCADVVFAPAPLVVDEPVVDEPVAEEVPVEA